jgi:hypothetical protein
MRIFGLKEEDAVYDCPSRGRPPAEAMGLPAFYCLQPHQAWLSCGPQLSVALCRYFLCPAFCCCYSRCNRVESGLARKTREGRRARESVQMEATYDVVVMGGGTAGVTASIQSGRAGARTLLVEKNAMLGGTMTSAASTTPRIFSPGAARSLAVSAGSWSARPLSRPGCPFRSPRRGLGTYASTQPSSPR